MLVQGTSATLEDDGQDETGAYENFHDDGESTCCSLLPTIALENQQNSFVIPETQPSKDMSVYYMNNFSSQKNPECLYTLPDKPPKSRIVTTGDSHSAGSDSSSVLFAQGVSGQSDSNYDTLQRPEIEQYLSEI